MPKEMRSLSVLALLLFLGTKSYFLTHVVKNDMGKTNEPP